jgi:hypothetical protein
MNVGIRTEAAQFLFWEYINWVFDTVCANQHCMGGYDKIRAVKKTIDRT